MRLRVHRSAQRANVMVLLVMLLAAVAMTPVHAESRRPAGDAELQDADAADAAEDARLAPLRLVEHVSVLVEDLTPDAERAGVTRQRIAVAAGGRLRVAGLRVSGATGPFPPLLYFQVSVLCNASDLCAIDVSSSVVQDVYLLKGAPRATQARTWATGRLLMATRDVVAERVREVVREQTDLFAADVLAARQRFSAGARGQSSRD
jgi:hypothetical protein